MGCQRRNRQRAAADHAVALRARGRRSGRHQYVGRTLVLCRAPAIEAELNGSLSSHADPRRKRLGYSARSTGLRSRTPTSWSQMVPPDAARGKRESAVVQTIVVPADARLFRVILNSNDAAPPGSDGYTLDVLGDNGSMVWHGEGLQRSRFRSSRWRCPGRCCPPGCTAWCSGWPTRRLRRPARGSFTSIPFTSATSSGGRAGTRLGRDAALERPKRPRYNLSTCLAGSRPRGRLRDVCRFHHDRRASGAGRGPGDTGANASGAGQEGTRSRTVFRGREDIVGRGRVEPFARQSGQ